MAFSFSSRLKRGASRRELLGHVLWRGLALFALGMFLNGFPNQYQLASWAFMACCSDRDLLCHRCDSGFVGRLARMDCNYRRLPGRLLDFDALRPVPGFGVPTHDIPLLDPDRNLAAWLDRRLLAGHLYEGTRDPEGVVSTIPAVATALLGMLTGQWLRSARSPRSKALAWHCSA